MCLPYMETHNFSVVTTTTVSFPPKKEFMLDGAIAKVEAHRGGTIRIGCFRTNIETLRAVCASYDRAFPEDTNKAILTP